MYAPPLLSKSSSSMTPLPCMTFSCNVVLARLFPGPPPTPSGSSLIRVVALVLAIAIAFIQKKVTARQRGVPFSSVRDDLAANTYFVLFSELFLVLC